MAVGLLRLGTYIKFIPYPVTVGFTAGIAVIIFASQLKDLFGLTLAGKEPGDSCPSSRRWRGAPARSTRRRLSLAAADDRPDRRRAGGCGRTGRAC